MFPIRSFIVADTSMQPALRPGDRILVFSWARPSVGNLVVLRDPEAQRTFLIKRVAAITPDGSYEVAGDNPNVSRDSRTFGPVARELVVGPVVWQSAKK